jgi:predicted transcriptional regulator
MSFHQALRNILDERGIKHVEFAGSVGISRSNLSHMLHGAGRKPSLQTLVKIVKALPKNVDIRKLILAEEVCDAKDIPEAP